MLQSTAAPTTVDAENPIAVMQRYELKYLLNRDQLLRLRQVMEGHMTEDQFGLTTIGTIYYDTPDRRLIRASIEKPAYKEKLRLRSYGPAAPGSPVFLELKRKALGTVYKRRIRTTPGAAARFVSGCQNEPEQSQIGRELRSFRDYYGTLIPSCLIIYDRTAYVEPDGDLRLTIDENPRYRVKDLDLSRLTEGTLLLDEGSAVLELKVQGAIPLWLSRFLSEAGIYKTSFSKYGEAYRRELAAGAQAGGRRGAFVPYSTTERIA